MAEEALAYRVTTVYQGNDRVRIEAGGRTFEADQRTTIDRPGASFCPLSLVAASLGA